VLAHELARYVYYTNATLNDEMVLMKDLLVSEGQIRVTTIKNLRRIKGI
jgi:hypothetical protein